MNEKNISLKDKFSKNFVTSELTGHKKRVYSLDWSFNGKRLASGSADNTIRVELI